MHATTTNSDSFPQAGAAMVLLAALVIGGAFILTEHYLSGPQMEDFAQQADDIEAAAAEGSSQRRLGFLLVGLLGVVFLARRRGSPSACTASCRRCCFFAWRGARPARCGPATSP